MSTTAAQFLALCLVALSVACTPEKPARPAYADLPPLETIFLKRPDLIIGATPGAEEDFALPYAVAEDADGGVFVYDVGLVDLRKFNSSGRLENVVARKGKGPGELASASAFLLHGDMLYAWEGRLGRMVTYTRAGKFVRQLDTDLRVMSGSGGSTSLMAIDGEDPIVRVITENRSNVEAERPAQAFRIIRLTPDGHVADTLYQFKAIAQSVSLEGGRSRISARVPYLGPTVLLDTVSMTFVRFERDVPKAGELACICVERVSSDGRVIKRASFGVPATEVEQSVRDSLTASVRRLIDMGGTVGKYTPERWQNLERIAGVTGNYPGVDRPYLGPNGTLWVKTHQRRDDGLDDWIILDADLTPIKRMGMMRAVRDLLFTNEHVWGSTEYDGVPAVVRFSISDALN